MGEQCQRKLVPTPRTEQGALGPSMERSGRRREAESGYSMPPPKRSSGKARLNKRRGKNEPG